MSRDSYRAIVDPTVEFISTDSLVRSLAGKPVFLIPESKEYNQDIGDYLFVVIPKDYFPGKNSITIGSKFLRPVTSQVKQIFENLSRK